LVFDAEANPWNVLALIAAGFGLFALGRWAFRPRDTHFNLPDDATSQLLAGMPQSNTAAHALAEQTALAPDAALEPVRITKFYFAKFDLASGPADPEVFYDELFVELYDADTAHRWMQSYGVATPRGLAQILQDKSWSYLFANGIIVLPKYNLAHIREAVIARLAEDNETFEPAEKPKEEEL
jgi:hypothetical protein